MLNAITYMDELEKKGFTREQAKASVNLWIELMNENLASKNDIKDLLHKMETDSLAVRHEFQSIRNEFQGEFQRIRHEMKDSEARLTIKMGGLIATAIGLITLIQKL